MLKQLLILFACTIYITTSQLPTTYTYKTVGNLTILADVYVPSTPPTPKYPVLLMIHGGGFIEGNKSLFAPEHYNETISRNWVAVSIDYRLSPGVLLDDIMQDVKDAYEWIRTELVKDIPLDPDYISLLGGSAGSGLAVMGGYMLTPPPKAILAFYTCLTNWTSSYIYNPDTPVSDDLVAAISPYRLNITEYPVVPHDAIAVMFSEVLMAEKYGWMMATEDPNEPGDVVMDKLRGFSVVYNINATYPPTFLGHGLNDTTVPYVQSVQMAGVLEENNVDYVLDLVPGAGHGYDGAKELTPEIWEDHVLPAYEFIQKYMINNQSVISI